MASVYAQLADLRARLPGVPLGQTDTPTQTTAQGWLEEGEAHLTAALRALEIPVPITDAEGVKILKGMATDYAEGRVRLTLRPTGDGVDDGVGQAMIDKFHETLEAWQNNPDRIAAMLLGGSSPTATRRVRASENEDPEFERTEVW